MKNNTKAYILASAVVVLWATVGSVFKLTLQDPSLDPATLPPPALRKLFPSELLLFAVPFPIIITAVFLTFQRGWLDVKESTNRQLTGSAFLGILNPFLYYTILFKAYSLLPAQKATTLNFTWPIALVLLSVPVLKQRPTLKGLTALFLGFLGVTFIGTEGPFWNFKFTNTTGVFLAVGSAFFWALFWLCNVRDKRNPAAKLFLNFCFAAPCVFALWLATTPPRIPPLEYLAGAVYAGFFEMGITFILWLTALSYAEKTEEIASLIYLTPFLALVFISFLVGETIKMSTVAGLILIVSGIVLQKSGKGKGAARSKEAA